MNVMEDTMARDTILYISDREADCNPVLIALEANGYDIVSASSSVAMAMDFVMHSVVVVVLDQLAEEQTCTDLAQRLQAIRPDVPIILLSSESIDPLPPWVAACVSTAEPFDKLTTVLDMMLNTDPAIHDSQPVDILRG
jgi:DNA-binding NtrC family response regulator